MRKLYAWRFWCARLYIANRTVVINLPFMSIRIFDGARLPNYDCVLYGWDVCLGWKNVKSWFYRQGAIAEYRWSWNDVEEYPTAMVEVLFGSYRVPTRSALLSAAMAETARIKRLLPH